MKLFEPITIGGVIHPNRIVMSAMHLGIGIRNPRAVAFYLERAKGGTGTIITTALSVDLFWSDEVWGKQGAVDKFVEGMARLVDPVHLQGARIGVQLWHGQRFPIGFGWEGSHGEWVAPSARIEPADCLHPGVPRGQAMREISMAEIESIVERFARASALIKRAGFDFVEVNGHGGHLVHQFFSPLDNHRTDKYGGSATGRMRFGIECVKAIKLATGSNYPLWYRIGAHDDLPGGVTLDQSVQYSCQLAKAGVDCLDVSVGIRKCRSLRQAYGVPNRRMPMGTFSHLAAAVKEKVRVPVMTVGRINSPTAAEAILEKRQADLVGIGRQLIADPYWPRKVKQGMGGQIILCESCNLNCQNLTVELIDGRKPDASIVAPLCKLNPNAGREYLA